MSYTRRNQGTCSVSTEVVLNPDDTIEKVEVLGGCDGNLQGIMRMLRGMKAQDAIAQLKGIRCGEKSTSCTDQISLALEGALAEKQRGTKKN